MGGRCLIGFHEDAVAHRIIDIDGVKVGRISGHFVGHYGIRIVFVSAEMPLQFTWYGDLGSLVIRFCQSYLISVRLAF